MKRCCSLPQSTNNFGFDQAVPSRNFNSSASIPSNSRAFWYILFTGFYSRYDRITINWHHMLSSVQTQKSLVVNTRRNSRTSSFSVQQMMRRGSTIYILHNSLRTKQLERLVLLAFCCASSPQHNLTNQSKPAYHPIHLRALAVHFFAWSPFCSA